MRKRKNSRKKSRKISAVVKQTYLRKFLARLRGVYVYVKKTTHTYSRAKSLLRPKNLSSVGEKILSDGTEFFAKEVGFKKSARRKLINARIVLQFKTKSGGTETRVINKARIKTRKLSSWINQLESVFTDAQNAVNRYDARKLTTDVQIKGYSFEAVQDEKTVKKVSRKKPKKRSSKRAKKASKKPAKKRAKKSKKKLRSLPSKTKRKRRTKKSK